jgi:hypothetical protein
MLTRVLTVWRGGLWSGGYGFVNKSSEMSDKKRCSPVPAPVHQIAPVSHRAAAATSRRTATMNYSEVHFKLKWALKWLTKKYIWQGVTKKQELNRSETSCYKIKSWRNICVSILIIGQTKSRGPGICFESYGFIHVVLEERVDHDIALSSGKSRGWPEEEARSW